MKKKWLAAALAGILLAAAVLSGCASTEKAKRLRFGVAGEGGIYREFGERFAALENETDNGQVELKATAGSAANLRLLAGEYLQLAIAQADLVQDAYDQTGIFADEEESHGPLCRPAHRGAGGRRSGRYRRPDRPGCCE